MSHACGASSCGSASTGHCMRMSSVSSRTTYHWSSLCRDDPARGAAEPHVVAPVVEDDDDILHHPLLLLRRVMDGYRRDPPTKYYAVECQSIGGVAYRTSCRVPCWIECGTEPCRELKILFYFHRPLSSEESVSTLHGREYDPLGLEWDP